MACDSTWDRNQISRLLSLLYLHIFITLTLDGLAGQFRTLVLPYKALLQTLIPSGRGGVDINI